MIVLDTNVVSEVIKPRPAETVMRWFASQPAAELFVTAITEAELLYGIAIMASGRRREQVERAVTTMFADRLTDRILPFDSAAAREFATIVAVRRKSGKPIDDFDAQIAAIARSRGAGVATRNVADFADCGIDVLDPWARP